MLPGWYLTIHRQVFRSNYRKSFEAAHGFLIKLIESASGSLHTPSTQESFLDEMLKFYPSLVLKVRVLNNEANDKLT